MISRLQNSFPVICECGKQIQSNSLFNHRKSKAHILEMQKPENKDNKPKLKFFSSGDDSD